MIALQKILFMISLITLLTQTVRHLYVRWIEPTKSVLDKYDSPVNEEIKKAGSLDELAKKYSEACWKTTDAENQVVCPTKNTKVISDAELLRTAIIEWEGRTKEIFKLRFFWFCGFVLTLCGLLCYKLEYLWLGLTVITVGIAEMIWWTSPSFRWRGETREFDKLLTNKIAFSLMSVIMLLITGYLVVQLASITTNL
jgi:hypothetical protein